MPPSLLTSSRLSAWISGAFLLAGSTLFAAGGRLHPRAATAFGTVGTPDFYRSFAEHIHAMPNWIPIHVLILMGPVLWALGLPRTDGRSVLSESTSDAVVRSSLEHLASRAMLLGAGLWVVVFVLDGFVAPQAAAIIASATPADAGSLLAAFRLNQVTVIRLGLVSWILIGVAMTLHGASMIGRARGLSPARVLLGVAGVAIGLWPIAATVIGEFDPGPFTSPRWNISALAAALWFAMVGVSSIVPERVRSIGSAIGASSRESTPDLALQGR
jgi:hypothetical protein